MAAHTEDTGDDNFKHIYKRYKRRDKPIDTSAVIDFSCLSNQELDIKKKVQAVKLSEPPDGNEFPGLKAVKNWNAYQLTQCPGFMVITNPFEPKYQRYWIQRCLLDFPTKPNRTNLDAHMERPSQIWHHCLENESPDLSKDSLLMKLRWATLGFQYEWNTKEYFSDRVQEFPDDLHHLCSYIAAALGYSAYSSEAGIVNYYRMESSLMGHTDVSELDKAAPLISFSFGQSCIFLIGGPTKETEPIPLFLHSGDICLMTGSARLSYHAVPRILPGKKEHLLYSFHGNIDNRDMQTKSVDSEKTEVLENGNESQQADHEYISRDPVSNNILNEEYIEDDPYSETGNEESQPVNIGQPNLAKDEKLKVTPTAKGKSCSVDELGILMDSVIAKTNWEPFGKYLETSRVNLNVRQVLKEGLSLSLSPETIKPCQKSCPKS